MIDLKIEGFEKHKGKELKFEEIVQKKEAPTKGTFFQTYFNTITEPKEKQ